MKNLLKLLLVSALLVACGHAETADIEAAHKTSVDAMISEFLDGGDAATKKYVDQVVEVTGAVLETETTKGKITGVKLGTDEAAIVNCTFQEPVESLPQGEITVKGICSGFMGDSESLMPGGIVEMKRCAIIQ